VETALEVVARDGFAGPELGDIAASAGVGRPLIYHYFAGGKEDLYVAALELAWAQLVDKLTVDPDRGSSLMRSNLAVYLDLAEAGDPAVTLVRQSRQLEGTEIREVTANAATLIARRIALNQLGDDDPHPLTLAALRAFIAYLESLIGEMLAGDLDRAEVETLVVETLPRIVAAAKAAAG
jgi:AcrR family transcriptional regulator